jgi:hypothetical protein
MALWVPPMPWPPWNSESTIWRPRWMSCWSSLMSWPASMPLQRPFCARWPAAPAGRRGELLPRAMGESPREGASKERCSEARVSSTAERPAGAARDRGGGGGSGHSVAVQPRRREGCRTGKRVAGSALRDGAGCEALRS